ncbi:MAG: ATP-binding cassette domain-containing protein [Nocardioides sp.]
MVLKIDDLVVTYGTGRTAHRAVDGVSLEVEPHSVVGLVGESGSGKSTLARAVVGLAPITSGRITWAGQPVPATRGRGGATRRIQYVFQDPYASLDPRMSVAASIAEGLVGGARRDRRKRVEELLDLVRLDPGDASKLPRELSGGQRQRVAIARALAAEPELLIADEITSALDVSVQGAVLNILRGIQTATGVAVLFISHNLAVVRYVSQRIAVMKDGRLVELAPTDEVIETPSHPYTRDLLRAVPTLRV